MTPTPEPVTEDGRQHVMPGDPDDLGGIALRWYCNFDWGAPHTSRESNMAVEGFKDGYRAALNTETARSGEGELREALIEARARLEGSAREINRLREAAMMAPKEPTGIAATIRTIDAALSTEAKDDV